MSQPRASAADLGRTALAAASLFTPLLRAALRGRTRELPATTTPDGLRAVQTMCREILGRLGVSLEVEHADRVPETCGVLLMWNQASHLDHLVLPAAIPRPFCSIYNNALKATPLYGEYLRSRGHFWIDKTDETQWRAQVAACAARVRDGACLLVSPEGTRSRDGRLLPMKRGAFLLAREAERPIVCATVIGAHARLPRGSIAVRPGPVRVVFSAPIEAVRGDPALELRVAETFERALLEKR